MWVWMWVWAVQIKTFPQDSTVIRCVCDTQIVSYCIYRLISFHIDGWLPTDTHTHTGKHQLRESMTQFRKTIKNFIALYSCHSYVSEKVKILQVWLGYQKLQLKVWTFPSDCLLWLLLLLPLLTVGSLTQFDANLQKDC